MNHLKKILLGLAVVAGLTLLGANNASADCTGSGSVTSSAFALRSEGTTEQAGIIAIVCTAAGIAANPPGSPAIITVSVGGGVKVDTATGVTTPPALPAGPAPGSLFATSAATVGGVANTCAVATAPDNKSTFACPALHFAGANPIPASSAVTTSTTAVTFQFTPAAAAQTIYITGIRLNVGAANLASGTAVTATVVTSGTIGSKSNSNVVLGIVSPVLGSGTAFPTTALALSACAPASATPLGNPTTVTGNPGVASTMTVTLNEGTLGIWQTAAAIIAGAAGFPADAAATQGIRVRIELTGVPTGFQAYVPQLIVNNQAAVVPPGTGASVITLVTGTAADGSGGTIVAGAAAGTFQRIDAVSGTIDIVYEVTTPATTTVFETMSVPVALTGTGPTGTGAIAGSINPAPVGPPTANASIPQFVAAKGSTVANVAACVSFLLFPWAVTDATFDTGLAISNTTADPSQIGTTAQTGDVTLFFFPTDLTTAAPQASFSQTISPTGGLKAGGTATFVLSVGLKTKPFYGYIIAVCNFTLCNGFAFIDTPNAGPASVAQGYLPIPITSARIGGPAPAGGR